MAKNKKTSGLSLSDIICTLAVLVTLFFVFCGWCYSGNDLQMSLIVSIITGLVLIGLMIGARSIKLSKPFNVVSWRVFEYSLIIVFCLVAIFAVMIPFGTFVNTEWVAAKEISTALDNDKYTVEQYSSVFVNNQKEKLGNTTVGLRNYYRDIPNGYDASAELINFINETVHAGIDQEITLTTIGAYEDHEVEALNDFSHNLAYMQSDSLYRISNFITKPGIIAQLLQDYNNVIDHTQEFNNNHKYPVVKIRGGRYDVIATDEEFGSTNESRLKTALENAGSFSALSIILFVILCFLILLPYIVTPRPTLIRAVDRSGKDLGGRPLK